LSPRFWLYEFSHIHVKRPHNTTAQTTMKTAVLASLVASAAAFAPSQQTRVSTAVQAKPFENELGAMTPVR
jgi:uncharacterized membrane protein